MRQWRPVRIEADGELEQQEKQQQEVLLKSYRHSVLELVHSVDPTGHLAGTETLNWITYHFYCPEMDADVRRYCKTCFPCQRAGKNVPAIPKALLVPVPAFGQVFERLLVDSVGLLSQTKKGNNYLLTIMCVSRFPEAILVRRLTSKGILGYL